MHLKRLTLKGFKSFADTTTLDLEPGITVVVGPNGSGKSNVVDAISWVLGAQAPKALRSGRMDDVIFAGTPARAALGRAEVTLTLDNADGALAVEAAEVTLRRTLFRSGDSEYALNGASCRLLDVQELLSDSGVGRTQHVLVGQGQLDAVLSARPDERRAVVEEAAGVLKYRRRKERAERRLASTEADLVRLADLLREVRRSLRPLERAAELARRHGALAAELSTLSRHLLGRELAALAVRVTAAVEIRSALAGEEAAVRTRLVDLDAEVASSEGELAARGVDDLGDDLVRLERLVATARGLARLVGERRRTLERERAGSLDLHLVASLEADAARLRSELGEAEVRAEALGPEAERLAAAEAALAGARAAVPVAPPDASPGALAEARAELAARRSGLERSAEELARRSASLGRAEATAADLTAEAERLERELAAAVAEEGGRVEEALAVESARERADADLVAAEANRRAVEAERASAASHRETLASALDSARARAGVERLAGVPGVLGTLLDLVEVDPGWEAAVESALGPALAAVVVDGAAPEARVALERLRASGEGAVLPLGLVRRPPAVPEAGVPVRAHVRGRGDAVDRLLDALLAGAGCVEGWAEALEAAARDPEALIVTADGERFAVDGWRVGTGGDGATGAALEAAAAREAASASAVAGAVAELDAVRTTALAARAEEVAGVRRRADDRARRASLVDASERARRSRRRADEEVVSMREAVVALEEGLAEERRRVVELDAVVPSLEAEAEAAAERGREAAAARDRLDRQAAAVGVLRADLHAEGRGLEERVGYLRRRLDEVEARLERDRVARDEAERRRVDLERRQVALERLGALVDARLGWAGAALAEVIERRRRSSESARAVAARLDDARRRRAADVRRLEEVRERVGRADLEVGEARLRAEAAAERAGRELDCDPSEALATPCPPLPEGTGAEARRRELERELRTIGPVNPLALEELAALAERHDFLLAQHEDVTASRRELTKVVRAVDDEITAVFAAAFADVASNFALLFGELFPGGTGALRLTDPGDLLRTGIEVEARPPGKNIRSLSLLSGGERSLAALAFLFAVFRSRPSPFYLLDEVEAALDDVNLSRFLSLLAGLGREAQLLVVSHQKRTMEIGDALYGVTLQPGGASKVVSERLTPVP